MHTYLRCFNSLRNFILIFYLRCIHPAFLSFSFYEYAVAGRRIVESHMQKIKSAEATWPKLGRVLAASEHVPAGRFSPGSKYRASVHCSN